MKYISLTINGRPVNCPEGASILEAAEGAGISIPTLCHHPDLTPFGACRLCLVEDEQSGRVTASCVTPAALDMRVRTDTPRVLRHRRNIVRLMMAEHPDSCLVCSKGNRCRLREIAAQLGVGETRLRPMPNYRDFEQANPFLTRDLSKCILCGKCIRADHELVGVGAIDYNLRGFRSRPATVYDRGLERSECTFCGTCAALCPTGALSEKNARYAGTPERQTDSVCGFCGAGCSLTLGEAGGRVVDVQPGHVETSVNGSTICVRGHFAHDFLNSPARLTTPLLREGDRMASVPWEEALEKVAEGLLDVKNRNGPQSLAFIGSTKCTNEENYLFQKIARVLLKTNNIDNGGSLAGRSALTFIDERTGGGGRRTPLKALEKAEAVFVAGADPTHSVPVLGYHLRRAARKGIPLVVADPRRTESAEIASVWLQVLPGRDAGLIHGLSALLHKNKAYDADFLERFTDGFASYEKELGALDLDRVIRGAGLEKNAVEEAVELLQGKRIAFVVGHGVLQQGGAREALEALLNLSLMTGSLGREGTGFYFPVRENNLIGAWDMGAAPDALPGRWPLSDEAAINGWSRIWRTKISPDRGLSLVRMIEEAEKGNLKAMFVMGENPLRSLPDPERVRRALERLDLLVVQDILDTETARVADVVLPGAAFSEKGGSFTNMEGRIQTFSRAASPPGEARADWEILDSLAFKMGHPDRYGSVEKIRAEISRLIPMYGDLEKASGTAWVNSASPKRVFNREGRGEPISFGPVHVPGEVPTDDAYPFTAIIGSKRFHLGSGTRTARSERIESFGARGEVEVPPGLASRLGLREGEGAKVISRFGSVEREVMIREGLGPATLFLPAGFHGNDVQRLIDLTPSGKAHSPGGKTCAVKLEKIEDR